MKISIITPSFNSSNYIERAIQSVVSQDYHNWEHIIVDGGSTDGTLEILKKYPHLKWVSEPDNGIYNAMNKGITKAQGEWLYFMGADDFLFDKNVISRVCEVISNGVQIVYGKYVNCSTNIIVGQRLTLQIFLQQNICHQTIFYHNSIFKQLGLYNEKYKILADAEFNMRWFSSKFVKSEFVDLAIVKYSATGISSLTFDIQYYNDYYKLIRRYFGISILNKLNAPLHKKLIFKFLDCENFILAFKHGVFYFFSHRSIESVRTLIFILRKYFKLL